MDIIDSMKDHVISEGKRATSITRTLTIFFITKMLMALVTMEFRTILTSQQTGFSARLSEKSKKVVDTENNPITVGFCL